MDLWRALEEVSVHVGSMGRGKGESIWILVRIRHGFVESLGWSTVSPGISGWEGGKGEKNTSFSWTVGRRWGKGKEFRPTLGANRYGFVESQGRGNVGGRTKNVVINSAFWQPTLTTWPQHPFQSFHELKCHMDFPETDPSTFPFTSSWDKLVQSPCLYFLGY